MPHPDYSYCASVVVACEGPGTGTVGRSPVGLMRSRDGATLANVIADGEWWHEHLRKHSLIDRHELLINPSCDQVVQALSEAAESLSQFSGEENWNGGQVDFVFAGHGSKDGGNVLGDGELDGNRIVDAILSAGPAVNGKRRVSAVLDSCHSGRTLGQVLTHERHTADFLVIDAFAACLHDEYAWELDDLGHGALTFTMRHRGNAHVDPRRLARAARDGDDAYLRIALQGFVPNAVTYLTRGRQSSIDVVNGHVVEVVGCGDFDLFDDEVNSLVAYLNRLEEARAALDEPAALKSDL